MVIKSSQIGRQKFLQAQRIEQAKPPSQVSKPSATKPKTESEKILDKLKKDPKAVPIYSGGKLVGYKTNPNTYETNLRYPGEGKTTIYRTEYEIKNGAVVVKTIDTYRTNRGSGEVKPIIVRKENLQTGDIEEAEWRNQSRKVTRRYNKFTGEGRDFGTAKDTQLEAGLVDPETGKTATPKRFKEIKEEKARKERLASIKKLKEFRSDQPVQQVGIKGKTTQIPYGRALDLTGQIRQEARPSPKPKQDPEFYKIAPGGKWYKGAAPTPEEIKQQRASTLIVSKGFADLYKEREEDITRIKTREAGLKAQQEFFTELKRSKDPAQFVAEVGITKGGIKTFKDIEQIQKELPETKLDTAALQSQLIGKYKLDWKTPGKEGFLARGRALLTAPKEFTLAQKQIVKERKALAEASPSERNIELYKQADKRSLAFAPGLEFAQKPLTYGAIFAVSAGVNILTPIVGAMAGAVLGTVKAAKIGSYLSSRLGLLYSASVVARGTQKVISDKDYYLRSGYGIAELAVEPGLEIAAFSTGAKVGAKAATKIKEVSLSKKVKGTTPQQAKTILEKEFKSNQARGFLEQQPQGQIEYKGLTTKIKGKKVYDIVPTTKQPSVELRVKDLEGFTLVRQTKIKGGKAVSKSAYVPELGKEYFVKPQDITKADRFLTEVRGVKDVVVRPTKTNIKLKGKELAPAMKSETFYTETKGLVSQEAITKGGLGGKVGSKVTYDVGRTQDITIREVAKGKFNLYDPGKTTGFTGGKSTAPGTYKKVSYTYKLEPQKQIGYTYQLEPPKELYKPIITESGEAIGSFKFTYDNGKYTRTFITAGKGITKKSDPFRPPKPSKPTKPIQVVESTGQGSQTIQVLEKPKIVTGVKLKTAQESKTKFAPLSGSKADTAQKQQAKQKSKTIFEETQKPKVYTDLSKVVSPKVDQSAILASKQSKFLSPIKRQQLISKQKQTTQQARLQAKAQAQALESMQAQGSKQDIGQIFDTAQAQGSKQAQQQEFKLEQDYIQLQQQKNIFQNPEIKPPTTKTPPPPKPPDPLGLDLPGTKGAGLFDVQVRRKGKFESIGKVKGIKQATLKGKKALKTTAAASFKLERIDQPMQRKSVVDDVLDILGKKEFRTAKQDSNIFVQKRSFRIGTAGEKREITYKGLGMLGNKKSKNPWVGGKAKKSLWL